METDSAFIKLLLPQRALTHLGKPEKGLGFADPAADGGITTEIEAAFMRDARIGKQRDVGKRNVITGEEAVCRQVLLHAIERRVAALDLFRIELGGVLAEIDDLEAAHRDIGLVAVLFPEQPFVHLGGSEGIARNERTVAREIADDGIGLRQRATVVESDGGNLAGTVHLEELRRTGLALAGVDLDPLVEHRELVADPLHLQTIAGIAIAVDPHRCPRAFGDRASGRKESVNRKRATQNW